MCFNGEIYYGIAAPPSQSENDGSFLFELLEKCSNNHEIMDLFAQIRGEWAIVYFCKRLNRIYFARDCLGRRSLLFLFTESNFIISSLGIKSDGDWIEVPADGIYHFDLPNIPTTINDISKTCWVTPASIHGPYGQLSDQTNQMVCISGNSHMYLNSKLDHMNDVMPDSNEDQVLVKPFSILNAEIPSTTDLNDKIHFYVDQLENVLLNAVGDRVASIPCCDKGEARLGILFSGGLDCMLLAAMAHKKISTSEPIELLNAAFENPRITQHHNHSNSFETCPDRKTARQGFEELCHMYPDREWRLVLVDVKYSEYLEHKDHVMQLAYPLETVMDLSIAIAFWFAACGHGTVISSKQQCQQGVKDDAFIDSSSVADDSNSVAVSDSYSERLNEHQFNSKTRQFNSKTRQFNSKTRQYKSKTRVLFSGLGADEQFGGYSRHTVAYKNRGWTGLIQELQKDVDRISTRNLGRDDRIVADHSKEVCNLQTFDSKVRFPFLDERVLKISCEMPVNAKVNPQLEKGVGDKLVLRKLAERLGLLKTSREPKRAVQFGARTAKMTESKQKGTDLLK